MERLSNTIKRLRWRQATAFYRLRWSQAPRYRVARIAFTGLAIFAVSCGVIVVLFLTTMQ